MKKIIFSISAALLSAGAMVSLQSCGDELKEYPWIVEGEAADTEGAGAHDMDACENELKGAIPFMLNYSHEGAGNWEPHNYQYNRSNHIDNYAGYWTTTKANFAFGPALPTLYFDPNNYMGGGMDNSVFIRSKNAVLYAATMENEFGDNIAKPQWRAIALIIQAYQGHEIVDFFGGAPFLDWRNGKQQSLTYQSGPEVYKQIFADLDEAIQILNDTKPSVAELQRVEGNNPYKTCCDWEWTRWVKFANTIKLRMAMNMVDYIDPDPVYGPENKPFTAQKIAEEAVNDPIGVLMPGDRDIAYVIPNNGENYVCCVYKISETWDDIRLNASLENILKHFNSPLLNDWFDPGQYSIKNSAGVEAPRKVYGVRAGIMQENIPSKSAGYGPFSSLSAKRKGMDQPFAKVAEATFARAEGALRGWNMGGSAKELYEQGIRECFKQWGYEEEVAKYLAQDNLPAVRYRDYYNDDNSIDGRCTVGVKWNDSDSNELKLEKIITQRWIAVWPLGAEAWATYRRTGYPRLLPVKVNYLPGVDTEMQIRRMCLIPNENNGNEISQLTEILGGDQTCGARVFWDVRSASWPKGADGRYTPVNF